MHYTMQSGKRTDTVTVRCPICNAVKYYPVGQYVSEFVTGYEQFCSDAHKKMFSGRLDMLVRKAAQVYGSHYREMWWDDEQLVDAMERYIVEHGGVIT